MLISLKSDVIATVKANIATYAIKVTNTKMVKKRTSKARTRNNISRSRSTSTKRKEKRVTANQKLVLHLNEALAIENAAIQSLQSRIKQARIESVKNDFKCT
jgi:hypothetical protein